MGDRSTYSRSTRSVVRGKNGMISTSQPLASAAGLKVLMDGGNAIDAAVAASAVLGVVEPFSAGIGGDTFAIYWDNEKKELVGLNGSGRSAGKMDAEALKASENIDKLPQYGVHTITVPGAVDAWDVLLSRYGTMDLKELLQPAIDYANEGFPVSEITALQWKMYAKALQTEEARRVFLIDGNPPKAGDVIENPDLARSLQLIAEKGSETLYKGELAESMVACIKKLGGALDLNDFEQHNSDWVEPISTNYKGYEVFELPPNGQGAMVLEMLNILEGYDLAGLGHNSADYMHLIVEAKKAAFSDRARYIADPDFADLPIERIISKEYAKKRRNNIDMMRSSEQTSWDWESSNTVYLSVADRFGNAVSFITSIYDHFGSGIVPERTGIIMQNRGTLFSLEKGHFNYLEPGKRPLHTIIPAFVMKDGKPWFCFGVMGGDMQPQGHVQVLLNMIEFGMDVQEAGEAPRVCHTDEGVALEQGIAWQERLGLLEKGHRIISKFDVFGGYQGILIDPLNGTYAGGADDRKDGCAMGY
ncbi:MAG TPA: gamma-glutamyltransferase [Anaerovoracaceae bacterium]|nr:gamma-glutamyltransferase [Anaerovoracaceae bacterium]